MHTLKQKGYSARYVPHLESRGFISSKRMQIYENMSKVVHMDFSLRQDFFSNVYYLYLFTVQAFNCPGPVYELNVVLVDEDHRLTSMSLL